MDFMWSFLIWWRAWSHVSELDGDYYVFDEAHYELVGERTRKRFKLGQPIRVQVVAVDRYLKTIDFLPVREF